MNNIVQLFRRENAFKDRDNQQGVEAETEPSLQDDQNQNPSD